MLVGSPAGRQHPPVMTVAVPLACAGAWGGSAFPTPEMDLGVSDSDQRPGGAEEPPPTVPFRGPVLKCGSGGYTLPPHSLGWRTKPAPCRQMRSSFRCKDGFSVEGKGFGGGCHTGLLLWEGDKGVRDRAVSFPAPRCRLVSGGRGKVSGRFLSEDKSTWVTGPPGPRD